MPVYKDEKRGTWYFKCNYRDWQDEIKTKMKRGFATKKEAQKCECEFVEMQSGNMNMQLSSFVEVYFNDKKQERSKEVAALETKLEDMQVVLELKEDRAAMVERHIQNQKADFQIKQREQQKKLDDIIAENEEREREGVELELKNSELRTEYYQTINKLANKKDEIYFAKQEVDKWKQVLDVAKWEQEQAQYELEEAKQLKNELLEIVDGDYYLKEQLISLRYQNQMLQEENKSLRDKLEKVYEFMKQFVLGGMNLLEKFKEWIGEKVNDVGKER